MGMRRYDIPQMSNDTAADFPARAAVITKTL